jgi:hypothetical protein
MALRIDNTPAPLTARFKENVSPWTYLYLPLAVLALVILGSRATTVVIGIFLFYGLLFTVVPIGRGAIIEVDNDEITWRKTFFDFVWSTRTTRFREIFTIRWIQQRWPWYSRYRIPSHILVKMDAGGHHKFAATITLGEYELLQRAIEARFPELYKLTENAHEEERAGLFN